MANILSVYLHWFCRNCKKKNSNIYSSCENCSPPHSMFLWLYLIDGYSWNIWVLFNLICKKIVFMQIESFRFYFNSIEFCFSFLDSTLGLFYQKIRPVKPNGGKMPPWPCWHQTSWTWTLRYSCPSNSQGLNYYMYR